MRTVMSSKLSQQQQQNVLCLCVHLFVCLSVYLQARPLPAQRQPPTKTPFTGKELFKGKYTMFPYQVCSTLSTVLPKFLLLFSIVVCFLFFKFLDV
jgi:hypothetical protein